MTDPFDSLKPVRRTPSIEELLFHMPWLSRNAPTAWERSFADGIAKNGRRRNWRPSPKQVAVMERLVSDMFAGQPAGGDVIET